MATIDNITHDTGPPLADHWDTISDPGSALSVTAAAGLDGTAFGIECDYDSITSPSKIENTFSAALASGQMRFRFRFNIDNLTQPGGIGADTIIGFGLPAATLGTYNILIFTDNSTVNGFSYEFSFRDDGQSISTLGGFSGDIPLGQGEHCIEYRVVRETFDGAADGIGEGFFDGASKVLVTDLENFNNFINFADFAAQFIELGNVSGIGYFDEFIIDDNASADLGCVAAFTPTLAPMTKPVDIDADGSNLYLALLDSGNPVLIKMATSLDADGSTVFEPGAGDDIGVQCGRFDTDVVWVAGAFDGTNVVEKSEDGGTTFTVKDPATFGDVEAFVVGPDSDIRVLIADDNVDVQETLDDGDTWTAINSGTGFNVNAIARLDKNVQESVFGNDAGANDNVDSSPNSGGDMEDFSTGFPTEDATRVIVN